MAIFSSRLVSLFAIAAVPFLQTAPDKRGTAVTASWKGAPPSIAMCQPLNLVLHVVAASDASEVIAEVVPTRGIEVVSGTRRWVGALLANQVVDLPVRVRFVEDGEWTLGAGLNIQRSGTVEGSGAVLNVIAADGKAVINPPPSLAGTRTPLGAGVERGVRAPAAGESDRNRATRSQTTRDRSGSRTPCSPRDSRPR